ncbi:MAG: phosphatase PAP2 family protein [Gemmatimonadota bacterium]|nr:phosphatase PAP2 family protein [Gemmatimonadota bacterium]
MRTLHRGRYLLVIVTALVAVVQAGHAQTSNLADSAVDHAHHPSLFTRSDAWTFGAFIAGAAALRPFDSQIANEIREPAAQRNRSAARAAKTFNFIGSPGTLLAGVAMYGVGRIGHFDRVADLGLHSTEAIVVSAGATFLIKGLAGRQRPSHAGVNDPDDFSFGGGFKSGGSSSFPSGHATAAFATATVVTLETHRWWPRSTWYVAPLMFGGASLVGVARLYTNAHWASDVIMGAGIGTLTGLKVFRYNHVTSRNNRANRWLLTAVPSISPSLDGHGATIGWSFAAPR